MLQFCLSRLPPLNALRAFEAAARHLSGTKAAEELYVTQAAISHQVKALEETLGVSLFRRFNRRLMLSDAGQIYLPALSEASPLRVVLDGRLRLPLTHDLVRRAGEQPTWLVTREGGQADRLRAYRDAGVDREVL